MLRVSASLWHVASHNKLFLLNRTTDFVVLHLLVVVSGRKESRRVPDSSGRVSRTPPQGTTTMVTVYDTLCHSNVVVFCLKERF